MVPILLPLIATQVASPSAAPVVVYDNTTTYLHMGMPMITATRNDSAEMGDEVRLAGRAREVTKLILRFWYYGTAPGTFDARIRFRGLTGDIKIAGPAIYTNGQITGYRLTETPSTAFYESNLVNDLKVDPGMNEYTFEIPRIKVPDRFVWTIQCYNNKGAVGNYGPAYYDPPTVGSSEDFFWHSDMGSPWISYSWGHEPCANFGARIYAVGVGTQSGKHPVIPPRI